MASETMNAVVFKGPRQIVTEERPKPKILEPTDAIVKVTVAGVCGSDLHFYRGHQKMDPGVICGHEFAGHVVAIGSDIKNFKISEKVVSTFTVSCMQCWFCKRGYTNRCIHGKSFGSLGFDGGQAEYVRVPFADGTLQHAPADVEDELLIMMADILPTGYYGAIRAIQHFQPAQDMKQNSLFQPQTLSEVVFVCLGCGPVGLCSIITAVSKGAGTVYAVDSVDDRLQEAENMGAIPLKLGRDDIKETVMNATGGRGADAVIELVGNAAALKSAFELVRPMGAISSIGFHQGEVPFTAFQAYSKNLNLNMGRAPARRVFDEALEVLKMNKDKFKTFITHKLPITEASHGYEIFEKQQARKVVLIP